MIDGRNFFGQPVGNNMKTYENIWKNTIIQDDYTTGCLLDYPYFKEDYKLNAPDLSKHQALDPNQKAIQQITVPGNLDPQEGAWKVLVLEELKETILDFSQ